MHLLKLCIPRNYEFTEINNHGFSVIDQPYFTALRFVKMTCASMPFGSSLSPTDFILMPLYRTLYARYLTTFLDDTVIEILICKEKKLSLIFEIVEPILVAPQSDGCVIWGYELHFFFPAK